MLRDVRIVPTGAANLRSVTEAFRRLGVKATMVRQGNEIEDAEAIILPGVGAFGPAMDLLREQGFAEPLRERIEAERPTLAICLGMQLLAQGSEEAPDTPGLGLLPGMARRLQAPVVPHMGWNCVDREYFYFANSYALARPIPGWETSFAHYAQSFVAMIRRGPVLACQFHPELSGGAGKRLLQEWLDAG